MTPSSIEPALRRLKICFLPPATYIGCSEGHNSPQKVYKELEIKLKPFDLEVALGERISMEDKVKYLKAILNCLEGSETSNATNHLKTIRKIILLWGINSSWLQNKPIRNYRKNVKRDTYILTNKALELTYLNFNKVQQKLVMTGSTGKIQLEEEIFKRSSLKSLKKSTRSSGLRLSLTKMLWCSTGPRTLLVLGLSYQI